MITLYLMFSPLMLEFFSDYEGNESVAEGWGKSNNDSSHTVHVEIPEYQYQRMNVNHLKDKLRKIKTSVWYKKIIDERLLTYLKEKAPLYADGTGMKKNQQNKNEDKSMKYFTKTTYGA